MQQDMLSIFIYFILIMRRVIVHRIDVRRRYLAIFSERRVGNDRWSREQGAGKLGTRNAEP